MANTINTQLLQSLADELLRQGYVVISEQENGRGFSAVKSGAEVKVYPDRRPTSLSAKEHVFPKTEPILYFKRDKDDVEVIDTLRATPPAVLIGAKPCDAASVDIIRKLFNWDYKDEFFNRRADNTVVIATACGYRDEFCFCTSVGLSPDSSKGADVYLVPAGADQFEIYAVTERGKEFLTRFLPGKEVSTPPPAPTTKEPAQAFDAAKVKQILNGEFESPVWNSLGERCIGCAQCAFTCPVCHCFDIVDESYAYTEGRRMKNWDACQFGLFTKHASGHNPREAQGKRYRQRINHKFNYFPERFGEVLCTGCGRCSRGCAVGMNILEVLRDIYIAGAKAVPAEA